LTLADPPRSLRVTRGQPLIGLMLDENGREVTRYFVDETAADAMSSNSVTHAALQTIGAWSDLDWDDIEAELERIRRESMPTPPISEL
jgi:hypothetical protein